MAIIYFDDNGNVSNVSALLDNKLSGKFNVGFPDNLLNDLTKSIEKNITIFKHTSSGLPIFVDRNDKETLNKYENYHENRQATEVISYKHNINLFDNLSEWGLQDILSVKYKKMFSQYNNQWYDEFLNDSIIDYSESSEVSFGVGSLTLSPNGKLCFNNISINDLVSHIDLYIESSSIKSLSVTINDIESSSNKDNVFKFTLPGNVKDVLINIKNQSSNFISINAVCLLY